MLKEIKGYEGLYKISDDGNVWSIRQEKWIKPIKHKLGYLKVNLTKNNKMRTFYIHRLVAVAFISNPLNKTEVNHKNEIKNDNRAENLEWVTRCENINYGTRTEKARRKLGIKVKQLKNECVVAEYMSINEAGRKTGISPICIDFCIRGIYKKAGGYTWRKV
jgi:hypothetical protein